MSTTRAIADQIVEQVFGTLARPTLIELADAIDKALQAERERATKVDNDLVFNVLAAARDRALSYDAISGERSGANSVRFAIQDVFTEGGFNLKRLPLSEKGSHSNEPMAE
jgi:hypothetical protein